MGDNVYLNRDKTAVVPEYAVGKKWQVTRAEAVRLGLLESKDKPVQARRSDAPLRTVEEVGPTAPQKRRTATRKKK